jgi:hypothetical protein
LSASEIRDCAARLAPDFVSAYALRASADLNPP